MHMTMTTTSLPCVWYQLYTAANHETPDDTAKLQKSNSQGLYRMQHHPLSTASQASGAYLPLVDAYVLACPALLVLEDELGVGTHHLCVEAGRQCAYRTHIQ